ncbi:hypothetical protein SprV_0602119900 [Sparganum proliferum]
MKKVLSSGSVDAASGRWEATHVLDCRRGPGTRNIRQFVRHQREQSMDEEEAEATISYRLQRQREREEFKNSSSSSADENSRSPLKSYGIYGGRINPTPRELFRLTAFSLPSSSASSVASLSLGSSSSESEQNQDDQEYFVDMRVMHMLLQQQMRRAKKLSIGRERGD